MSDHRHSESYLEEVLEELAEARENLYKAGKCGNTLLSTNQLLNDKLDAREKEYAEQLEVLEQENYSLRMRLECQQDSISSLQQELESMFSQKEQELATQEKRLDELHTKKTSQLTLYIDDLKSDIGKLNVQLKTYQERSKIQEEMIEQLRDNANSNGNSTQLHNDLIDLDKLYTDEKAKCEDLELQVLEERGQLEVATMEIATLQQKLAGLEEEHNRVTKEWCDALQTSKDHNAELSSQLELLKCQEVDGTSHSKTSGNSLFGEVNDHRIEVERKYISLKVKYESLERTHSTTKQQLKKMKAEMSALLCQYSSTAADAAQVQRLQRALSQSKSELQTLTAKLHRLERLQAQPGAVQDMKNYMSAFVDLGDKTEYIHFLEQELEQEKISHAKVIGELDLKRTQLLWETNKLSESEAKLHQSQQELAKLRKERSKHILKKQDALLDQLEQVKNVCQQHEADKKYLENELKAMGTYKQTVPPTTDSTNTSDHLSTDENLTTGPLAVANDLKRVVPHKDINILEDLDKEFNKRLGNNPDSQISSRLDKKSRPMCTKMDEIKVEEDSWSGSAKVVHVSKDTVNKCPQQ